jgi:cell division septation protein DedD
MKQLFFALLVLCMLGAGVLWWLMQAVPSPNPLAPKGDAPHSQSQVPAEAASHGAPAESHGEEALDGKEEAKAEGHGEEAAHGQAASEHGDAASAPALEKKDEEAAERRLEIATEPVSAEVFVDGALQGQAPLEVTLSEHAREIVLKAEGFEEYKREAPSTADGSGPLSWKVQLKPLKGKLQSPPRKEAAPAKGKAAPAKAHAKAEHTAPAEPAPAAGTFVHGSLKGFYLQLESMPETEAEALVEAKVKELRTASASPNIHACRVDLMAKGRWTRVLAGPYETKGQAAQALNKLKSKLPEGAFVTGGQPCL